MVLALPADQVQAVHHGRQGAAQFVADHGHKLNAVVALVADTDVLVGRMLKRAQTDGRTDDSEEVIRHRQDVYTAETKPLLQVYAQRGLLVEVDGVGEIDEVSERVLAALKTITE